MGITVVTQTQRVVVKGAGAAYSNAKVQAYLRTILTTNGDLLTVAAGVLARVGVGSSGQVLTVSGGAPTWAAPTGFANPMSAAGDLIIGGASGAATRLARGADGQVLTVSGSSVIWASPAATYTDADAIAAIAGELTDSQLVQRQNGTSLQGISLSTIYDGAIDAIEALGNGVLVTAAGVLDNVVGSTSGHVLTWNGTTAVFAAPASGFTNPMTTAGDLIVGGVSGAAGRLGIGSNGYVLTSNGTTATWAASTGISNPLTTLGDVFVGGASGAPDRLPVGSYNAWQTIGLSSAGVPAWVDLPGAVVGWIHDSTTAHGILGPTVTSTGASNSNLNTANGPEHRRATSATAQIVTGTTFGFKPRFRVVVAFVVRNAFPTGAGGFAFGVGNASLTSLLATNRIQIVSDNTTYGDTNYRAYVRGAGSPTEVDLGFAPVIDQFVEACFTFFDGGVIVKCLDEDGAVLGTPATITSNLPAVGTLLAVNLLGIGGGVNSPQTCVVRGRTRVELIR